MQGTEASAAECPWGCEGGEPEREVVSARGYLSSLCPVGTLEEAVGLFSWRTRQDTVSSVSLSASFEECREAKAETL